MYRLRTIPAPVHPTSYTVDVDALAELSRNIRPKLITIGGSLNLIPHPVSAIREIADSDGAKVLFDAAHLCGLIAGGAWPNPLDQGAHLMSMSTDKSLGGPPGWPRRCSTGRSSARRTRPQWSTRAGAGGSARRLRTAGVPPRRGHHRLPSVRARGRRLRWWPGGGSPAAPSEHPGVRDRTSARLSPATSTAYDWARPRSPGWA